MSALFQEAAQSIDLAAIRTAKQNGMPVVGLTCSFAPVEIFYAAGIVPVRLRGIHTESLAIGDAYYGPFVCTFPKALLQQAGSGFYDFLDGAVITSGCDGMRRLDECWRKMGSDIEGTLPRWFTLFDVPHKPDGVALSWYESRIRKLMAAIEERFHVTITIEALEKAIRDQNMIREKIWELGVLRSQDPVFITGTEAFEALIARTVLPSDVYLDALTSLVDEVKNRTEPVSLGKKRLFVTGSICDDVDLFRQIEEKGAVVVGESVCYGMRNSCDTVREDQDPVTALAEHYLSGSICPRMFGYYPMRRDAILDMVKTAKADGVIMQNIRFCDLHGSENGLLEKDLEKEGIPALRIEKEYGTLTEKGRLRMRFDAFLEQLKSGDT